MPSTATARATASTWHTREPTASSRSNSATARPAHASPPAPRTSRASYRVGLGLAGEVEAGKLSLLLSQPLGVKSVTNPFDATGAADPETLDRAREHAPLTVLTFERIVSLQDFEDFAAAFAGVGKAQATWLWDGESRLVQLTVAADNGDPLSSSSLTYQNLTEAIRASGDPPRARSRRPVRAADVRTRGERPRQRRL